VTAPAPRSRMDGRHVSHAPVLSLGVGGRLEMAGGRRCWIFTPRPLSWAGEGQATGAAMDGFRDPAGATRAATVALGIYMVLDLLAAMLRFADPAPGGAGDLAALPLFFALIACFILVGRWIYRTNANAHLLSDEMTITPGWSVGWFFIPFANLVKPYEGVKETWRASHLAGGLDPEAEANLLPWWWGLWLLTNILSTVAAQADGGFDQTPSSGIVALELVAALINVPLCLILIRLMRRLARAQTLAVQVSAFA
jgi:hypothetical protein